MVMTLAHQKIKNINKLNYSDLGKIFNIMLGKIKKDHGEVLITRRVEYPGLHVDEW
ncbi:hypothetical protein ES704_01843 [subsurface metagenome]|jgi:hypothetical protein